MEVHAGADDYNALVARLPGEAAAKQAYYSVIIKRPDAVGLLGAIKAVKENDLSFGNFPWLLVAGGFLLALGLGIGLMFLEVDRPLRRLTADAVRLAKGEVERMTEDAHDGKLGSVARSVNIHIDKLGREAKSAKKDLDHLLGPAPEGSLGTIDLLATALPSARPGGPVSALAPPSEFRFQDTGPPPSELRLQDSGPVAQRKPPARPGTPPPFRAVTTQPAAPPPAPPRRTSQPYPTQPSHGAPPLPRAVTPPPLNLEDDVLGRGSSGSLGALGALSSSGSSGSSGSLGALGSSNAMGSLDLLDLDPPRIDPYFKQVFDQFVAIKKTCNESIAGLVYERFAEKLTKNREDLMAKTGCREVRFTVYVKDGKAALKATPVKDEG
jgi:hypothetical protein